MYEKINKVPEFYVIFSRKFIKMSKFLSHLSEKLTKFSNFNDIRPKNARIVHDNYPKNIFAIFFLGGVPPLPPLPLSPTTMRR